MASSALAPVAFTQAAIATNNAAAVKKIASVLKGSSIESNRLASGFIISGLFSVLIHNHGCRKGREAACSDASPWGQKRFVLQKLNRQTDELRCSVPSRVGMHDIETRTVARHRARQIERGNGSGVGVAADAKCAVG